VDCIWGASASRWQSATAYASHSTSLWPSATLLCNLLHSIASKYLWSRGRQQHCKKTPKVVLPTPFNICLFISPPPSCASPTHRYQLTNHYHMRPCVVVACVRSVFRCGSSLLPQNDENFPKELAEYTNLAWLRLRNTGYVSRTFQHRTHTPTMVLHTRLRVSTQFDATFADRR
jgi:hypothetical protein